tara:strand:+ start:291 stop:770 length:480 start_codon:yes stop_codon:yes gene_type:complete
MNSKQYFIVLAVFVVLLSCKNKTTSSKEKEPTINETVVEESKGAINQSSNLDKDQIIKNLQGKWKEPEYPFRSVEIREQEAKFTEEGVVEEPKFRAFEISSKCPFEVNNIKNTTYSDIIFIITEKERCEKLKITDSTLIFSGYSTNTEKGYEIVYNKVE